MITVILKHSVLCGKYMGFVCFVKNLTQFRDERSEMCVYSSLSLTILLFKGHNTCTPFFSKCFFKQLWARKYS